ncbi:MAG TPA: TonB-dependent receptor plug domain-containing protein, partial [Casimicrobiaceae bacterium]|nr:TonB-dependent receptor plug domain-containing protein [Casimicrobiaceae bacterium]
MNPHTARGAFRGACRRAARLALRAALASCAMALAAWCIPAAAQSLQDLGSLSIDELAGVEITSVSKRPEPIASAPAAVYVITSDEIRRSGATTLAEALRLAPNLEVARVDSQTYSISAHGMNSVNAANKLLVLIDGRSVYTPFFSSVFWDQQHIVLADVDRIEVISGPGGSLWGANAMNGVVNIITKSAAQTGGGLVDAKAGDFMQRADTRWGGRFGEGGTYRVYALATHDGDTRLADGASAMDAWRSKQAGFRADTPALEGNVTLQGDMYENTVDAPAGRRDGGNLLGRWSRQWGDGSSADVQAYYDEQSRADLGANGGSQSDRVRTVDIQAEHSFRIGTAQRIVWGAGYRTWT